MKITELLHDGATWTIGVIDKDGDEVFIAITDAQKSHFEDLGVPVYEG